jgi:hypothetical protein
MAVRHSKEPRTLKPGTQLTFIALSRAHLSGPTVVTASFGGLQREGAA